MGHRGESGWMADGCSVLGTPHHSLPTLPPLHPTHTTPHPTYTHAHTRTQVTTATDNPTFLETAGRHIQEKITGACVGAWVCVRATVRAHACVCVLFVTLTYLP